MKLLVDMAEHGYCPLRTDTGWCGAISHYTDWQDESKEIECDSGDIPHAPENCPLRKGVIVIAPQSKERKR